eukprot:11201143-Lingulodinium_polyedra.AAC.1
MHAPGVLYDIASVILVVCMHAAIIALGDHCTGHGQWQPVNDTQTLHKIVAAAALCQWVSLEAWRWWHAVALAVQTTLPKYCQAWCG